MAISHKLFGPWVPSYVPHIILPRYITFHYHLHIYTIGYVIFKHFDGLRVTLTLMLILLPEP